MKIKIPCNVFWNTMIDKVREFYGDKTMHIKDMTELLINYMGLKYIETDEVFDENSKYIGVFIFEVINKMQFFLIRIKYGI